MRRSQPDSSVQYLRLEAPGFRLEEEALRAALRPNTRALVLCTPVESDGPHARPRGARGRGPRGASTTGPAGHHGRDLRGDSLRRSRARLAGDGRRARRALRSRSWGSRRPSASPAGASATPSRRRAMAEAMTLVHDLFYICAPTPLQHGDPGGHGARATDFYADDARGVHATSARRMCGALETLSGLDAGRARRVPTTSSRTSRAWAAWTRRRPR